MRNQLLYSLLIAWVVSACCFDDGSGNNICYNPDSIRNPDSGVSAPSNCWSADPIEDLSTVGTPLPPAPASLEMTRCGATFEYAAYSHTRSALCASDGGNCRDGEDDDCDGCVDENATAGGEYCCERCGGTRIPQNDLIWKPSAYTFGANTAWTAEAKGTGCLERGDSCRAKVADIRYQCEPNGRTYFDPATGALAVTNALKFKGNVKVLDRLPDSCLWDRATGAFRRDAQGRLICGLASSANYFSVKSQTCTNLTVGVKMTVKVVGGSASVRITPLDSSDPRTPAVTTVARYRDGLNSAFTCLAQAAAEANTFGDLRDRNGVAGFDACEDQDGDTVADENDNCVSAANSQQENTDGDSLGDACDCRLPEDRLERECVADLGPGELTCPDGSSEPACQSLNMTWADYDDQVVLNALDNGEAIPAQMEPVLYVDEPQGGVVANQQRLGFDYEKWLCDKMLSPAMNNARYTYCVSNTTIATRPRYTTVPGQWSLPETLVNSRSIPIALPAGRTRFPDYLVDAPRHNVLGEAKCYKTVEDLSASNTAYAWARFAAFGTQMTDYLNKAMASRREGKRTSVRYHFCRTPPRWAQLMVVAGIASLGANEFNEQSLEPTFVPGVNPESVYSDAICTDGIALSTALFNCFVPGQVNADNLPSCIGGSWYDACRGSE